MVLLPKNFLLLVALRCNSRGDITTILIFFLEPCTKSPAVVVVKKYLLSLFLSLLVLQPEVLVDQDWRFNKNCLKTFPRQSACPSQESH